MIGSTSRGHTLSARIESSVLLNFSTRWYNPQTLVDMKSIRMKERAKQLQMSERKPKTFKPALDHFRLTRFGWEHRKAGSEGERKRKKSSKSAHLASRVAYVNPRDFKTLSLYFPHMKLAQRVMPVDPNINRRRDRNLLPAHIG
jgi:hypothetical protein